MKSQINILRQLQEMVLIRDEHHQTGDGSHLDSLNDSIEALQSKLDGQIVDVYARLYKKNHIVLAALSNGCCAGCGMQVPIAQIQQAKLGQHLVTCSSCGRILFADDADAAHNVAEKADRDDVKTGVSRFSAQELMVIGLEGSREDAIAALAKAMEDNKFISNADSLIAGALERESVLSTAMGEGVAFPHVRGVEGGALTFAVGVSRKGIDWDGEKVNIVVLSAIPVAVSAFYLRLMAGLSQAFAKKDVRSVMMEADSPVALWKSLVKATRQTVK